MLVTEALFTPKVTQHAVESDAATPDCGLMAALCRQTGKG